MNVEELRTFFGMLKVCANGEGQIIIDNDMCKELQKNIEYLIKHEEQQDIKIQEIKKFIKEKYSNEDGEIWHSDFKEIYKIINKEEK